MLFSLLVYLWHFLALQLATLRKPDYIRDRYKEYYQVFVSCVSREHHTFLKLCLRLLSNHLALALAGGVATSILGRQARPLRNLLFRLMDSSVPDEIQEVRNDKSPLWSWGGCLE